MSLIVAVLAGLSAANPKSSDDLSYTFHFDGQVASTTGQMPTVCENVRFAAGRTGLAAEFTKGALLAYPTAEGFDPRRGTLSMWIRPNWDSENAFGDRFFWGVTNRDGSHRTVLGFKGDDGPGVVYLGGDGALSGLAAPINWRAGEWHHVAVCWDQESQCRALYVDGRLRHRMFDAGGLSDDAEVFHVGSLPCITRWMGVMDGHEADAAIDDLVLTRTVDMPGFEYVRQAAREDAKAKERNRLSVEKAKPSYEAARERFLVSPALDDVAQRKHEATWEELAGMAAPMSQRIPIQPRYASDIVYVHPDMSIALGRANEAYGLGFACDEPFRLPDMYSVARALHRGYLPIVQSTWATDSCELRQTTLTLLPTDAEVVTGRELVQVVVHCSMRNLSSHRRTLPLYVLMGRLHGTQNTNYSPFLASASRWLEPSLPVRMEGDAVLLDGKPFLIYNTHEATTAAFVPEFHTETLDPLLPEVLRNVLRFEFDVPPGDSATLDLVVVANAETDAHVTLETLRQTRFESALNDASAYWERGLEAGMKWTTPEPRVNDLYRHLILSCLGNMRKNPDRPWHEPYQSPVWEGVWPWEYAHMAVPLSALGFHRELEPSLAFFTQRQSGIGPFAEPGRKPEGETKSAYGCYSGNFLLRWTCETGAVLWAMASKCRYSQDTTWLKDNRDSILAAWDWIQGERARTRRYTPEGERVAYYGLMPKGRVHDWEGWRYHFFSDVFTWKGMSEMAMAFHSAGLPDAERLSSEAAEYRECLLAAVARAETVDPLTGRRFVPNIVVTEPGEEGGLWWADGPACMFATGLLDARNDARFDDMFAYLQETWGTMIGLTNRMDEPKALGRRNPFWYVNCSERGYFQNWLARGEVEKALLLFYSNLAYGLSQDCFQTVERIHVSDANYAPFQPNASGNGRLLDMMRRMVLDDQEPGVLWLFRGCPRRWFAPGHEIVVEDAPTFSGPMGFRTHAEQNRVMIEIMPPSNGPVPELRIALSRFLDRAPSSITINGQAVEAEDGAVALRDAQGPQHIVCRY